MVDHWLLWQLVDSAFPTGGFAHSGGLEAAWQHGEIRQRPDLRAWLQASLGQLTFAGLPFVNAAHADPTALASIDRCCDAFTTNHVANRASRAQGRALWAVVPRVFPGFAAGSATNGGHPGPGWSCGHWAPVFGAVMRQLGVNHEMTVRLFVFQHLRGLLAAAVRLNIIGPMEGQALQFEFRHLEESVVRQGRDLGLEDVTQTHPLLDIWQGAQDRLYSRLFQS